jgi:ribosomal protein S18 acetylase RimI-like enzyme
MNIRPATPDDADAFHRYVVMTSSEYDFFFAPRTREAMADFFRRRNHIFSHEHARFAEIDGNTAGMILSYSGKQQYAGMPQSAMIFLKNLGAGVFTKMSSLVQYATRGGPAGITDHYISNLATDPDFRRRGVAQALLADAERLAQAASCKCFSLDMDKDNPPAAALYEKLGFKTVSEFSLNLETTHHYYRMVKKLD